MSRAVVTAEADDPMALVARQMYERRLKSMPVVKPDGTVLGVIARRDVLRAFVRLSPLPARP
jgi:CBS domain-containing protein